MSEAFQFKITLLSPYRKIWRRVQIPFNIDFGSFHAVIQVAMGWYDAHLHEFQNKKQRIVPPMLLEDEWMDMGTTALSEDEVFLTDIFKRKGTKIHYLYDFGDGWEHELKYEDIVPFQENVDYPVCTAGMGACPPEDCGGIHGYENLIQILSDPDHDEYEDWLEWVGGEFDPDHFDIEKVNDQYARWTEGPVSEEEMEGALQELEDQMPEDVMNEKMDVFSGLTYKQIKALLEHPLANQSPLAFSSQISDELLDSSPYLRVAEYLISEISAQKELKLTSKGNLPLKIVKAVYELGLARNEGLEAGYVKVQTEEHMMEVHTVRILLELGKLIKKRNNKFSLTQKGTKLIKEGRTALFHRLIEIFLTQFNIGYWDGYGENSIGQSGAGYLIYLLKLLGSTSQSQQLYIQKYNEAFPMLEMQVLNRRPEIVTDFDPKKEVGKIMILRFFVRGMAKWGLAEVSPTAEHRILNQSYEIQSTALFDAWVQGVKSEGT